MKSKKRILDAFNHIKSDRVPINYFANPTIHAKVQSTLKAKNYEEVLRAFHVDFRTIHSYFNGENRFKQIDGLDVNPVYGYYTKWVENEYGGYHDFCNFPLQHADAETIANFHVPSADDFTYSEIKNMTDQYKEFALSCGHAGFADIINSTARVFGMEDTLVNLQIEDEATLHYISKRCDMELGVLERTIEAAKGGIDFMWIGEDLGTQHAPMISLDLYRNVLRPFHQKYIDLAKNYHLPVMVHTCGSSSWVYHDFIEMGVRAVDTLQPEATHMSPQYLANNFGKQLAFHGSISTAGALANGTTQDVENDVRKTLEIMKPTHGYMLAPTHMIQDNSPVENILKLYECAITYGKYE